MRIDSETRRAGEAVAQGLQLVEAAHDVRGPLPTVDELPELDDDELHSRVAAAAEGLRVAAERADAQLADADGSGEDSDSSQDRRRVAACADTQCRLAMAQRRGASEAIATHVCVDGKVTRHVLARGVGWPRRIVRRGHACALRLASAAAGALVQMSKATRHDRSFWHDRS